jgi:hypothetical protein
MAGGVGLGGTVAVGAGAGFVGNGVQQAIDIGTGAQPGGYNVASALTSTAAGGVAAGVLKPFSGIAAPAYAGTTQSLLTRYVNGTISQVAPTTAAKMVGTSILGENVVEGSLLEDQIKEAITGMSTTPTAGVSGPGAISPSPGWLTNSLK